MYSSDLKFHCQSFRWRERKKQLNNMVKHMNTRLHLRNNLLLVLFISFLYFGCTESPGHMSTDEYSLDKQIIYSYLIDSFYIHDPEPHLGEVRLVVITEHTTSFPEKIVSEDEPTLMGGNSKKESIDLLSRELHLSKAKELMDNFFTINDSASFMNKQLIRISLPFMIVPEDSIVWVLNHDNQRYVHLNYKAFYKKYPFSNGFIQFSRIAFTKDNSYALVYMQSAKAGKNGWGDWIVLEKVNGIWAIKDRIPDWIS